ncbi:MAG TPA: family 78 glycoside hydrolase catalytic domain [Candidatus Angelobacter sp.]|nr:family 78 glycoside hydrolase catalytic domain [Candidatus Angelobacter sp.]
MKSVLKTLCLLAFTLTLTSHAALMPTNLRCEYAVNPLGVDVPNPRLFWIDESAARGQRQTAYQILVASSSAELADDGGDLWDSGKVASDETIQIPYRGSELNSLRQVFWKVRVWDTNGEVSAWSEPASWTMGLLQANEWNARWIGAGDTNLPSILLRREFAVKPGLTRAIAVVCGLGQYEMSLNGKKVGDDFLSPGWSEYDKTCLYDVRDITADLRPGPNAVGFELGNGMYNVFNDPGRFTKFKRTFGPQKLIAHIRLEYADGRVEIIGTDKNWRVSPGSITYSSIYGGEDCDARLAQQGWNEPGFNDAKWAAPKILGEGGAELRGLSCAAPPIRVIEIHKPIATRTLSNGDIVFDFGQNAAHVPRITISGPAGSKVRLMPSELIDATGAVNQGSMGGGHRGYIWCDFTKGTDGAEMWSPKFFYVGCRYIQAHLTAATNGALPKINSIEAAVIQSSSQPVGEFECSNPLFNRIRDLVRWAQRNNMVSILTDCPHRERLGWLEQDHLNGPALRYEFDLAQLFTKTLNDIADSQLTNGLVPTTAPEYAIFRDKNDAHHLRNMFGDSPEWSSSFILVPWQQYEFDGDLNLFRLHYEAMKDYVAYLGSRADGYIVNYGLGDWYDVGPKKPGISQLTPIPLTGTAFYYEDVKIMARAAALLGKHDDAKNYSALAQKIRAAFNEKFYNSTNHCYATDSQCANAIALAMDLCEPANRAAVVDAIVRDVRSRGNALTAGDVGYRYLLRALADGGRSDVIFDMNDQTNKPGYGMQVAKGKTSLTEAWDGGSSQDHFMLGQIEEWFYHDLAGIQSAPDLPAGRRQHVAAGFKEIIINPQPVGDITWAKASYDSIRGKIMSDWKREGTSFNLSVTIPANTTATIFIPAVNVESVMESGKLAQRSAGVNFLRMQEGRAVFAVSSGSYDFESIF